MMVLNDGEPTGGGGGGGMGQLPINYTIRFSPVFYQGPEERQR